MMYSAFFVIQQISIHSTNTYDLWDILIKWLFWRYTIACSGPQSGPFTACLVCQLLFENIMDCSPNRYAEGNICEHFDSVWAHSPSCFPCCHLGHHDSSSFLHLCSSPPPQRSPVSFRLTPSQLPVRPWTHLWDDTCDMIRPHQLSCQLPFAISY